MAIPILSAAAIVATCSIQTPAACANTNQLVISSGFRTALDRFLAGLHGSYETQEDSPVADQALLVLHGPPDDHRQLGGSFVFTACMAHACSEKGALVVSPAGAIQAVGILYSNCERAHPERCGEHMKMTLFNRDAPAAVTIWLEQWATRQVAGSYHLAGTPAVVFDGMETLSVGR